MYMDDIIITHRLLSWKRSLFEKKQSHPWCQLQEAKPDTEK